MSVARYRPSSGFLTLNNVKNAIRYGQKIGRAIERFQRSRQSSRPNKPAPSYDSTPLTGQYDYKTDYRKKRLTRRKRRIVKKRRKWKKKIVNTVRSANVGTTHVVRRSLALLNSATNESNSVCYGLYGLNGTSNDDFNSTADVREIYREVSNSDFIDANNLSAQTQNHELYFIHSTMELTVRNNGSTDALLEAYFIRGQKRSPVNTSPTGIYAGAFAKSAIAFDPNQNPTLVNPLAPIAGQTFDRKLVFSDIGVTPFQAPYFCQHYKIYKRTKFSIAPGQEINFVIHEKKPRTFFMSTAATASTDKRYHGILFQQQGPPNAIDPPTNALPTSCTYLAVRRYRLKMFRDNLSKTAFDVSGT